MRVVQRPAEFEALQLAGPNAEEVAKWCGGHATDTLPWSYSLGAYRLPGRDFAFVKFAQEGSVIVPTWGGGYELLAPHQWLLKAHNGHFLVVNDEDFERSFKEVPDPPEPEPEPRLYKVKDLCPDDEILTVTGVRDWVRAVVHSQSNPSEIIVTLTGSQPSIYHENEDVLVYWKEDSQ